MENIVIFASVIVEMFLTSWMFDGLVHWSDHVHRWEKKMHAKLEEKKKPDVVVEDTDPQPDYISW